MASNSPVVPAPGHVNDVYSKIVAVINIDESTRYQKEIEDVREVRFVLRKFVHAVVGLAESNSSDKEAYCEAARTVGSSHASSSPGGSVGTQTAEVLCKIFEDAPWSLKSGVSVQAQEINVTLKGIKDGIKAAINTLSEALKEDGTEGLEYGEEQASSEGPKTPSKSRRGGSVASTPSRTPGTGQGNRGHGPGRMWTDAESLEILRVVRDVGGTHEQLYVEFNRRMAARGVTGEDSRTQNAWRLQLGKLNKAGTTVEDLEEAIRNAN